MKLTKRQKEVLDLLSKKGPLTISQLAKELDCTYQNAHNIVKKLIDMGLVKRNENYYHYKETNEYVPTILGKKYADIEYGMMRVHDIKVVLRGYRVNLHVVVDKAYKRAKMNNWEAYYIDLTNFLPKIPNIERITAQINDAKERSVVIHIDGNIYAQTKERALILVQNIVSKCRRALEAIGVYTFEEWENIDWRPEMIHAEYSFKIPEQCPVDDGTTIKLGRNAKDLQGIETKYEATVWFDESLGYKEAEGNDSDWAEKFAKMPYVVEKIEHTLTDYKGFITETKEVVEAITEAGKALSEHTKSHIPYVQNAAVALIKITENMELLQQQQRQFLEAMRNQSRMIETLSQLILNNNKADQHSHLFIFVLFLLLILLVKGVIF